MKPIRLFDKEAIENFLRSNTWLHIYEIGDLDDFFWPHTIWYGLKENGAIVHLALFYTVSTPPVLLSLTDRHPAGLSQWFQALFPLLPDRVYTHLSPGMLPIFRDHFHLSSSASMNKMALTDPRQPGLVDTTGAEALSRSDLTDLMELYEIGYPDNAFDPRMLETGCFFGIRRAGKLVSVAGIHVYSPVYRVAALGNVTTHPDFRRQGLGRAACAALCRFLLQSVDHIGLNVNRQNPQAIGLYEHLGFSVCAPYEEATFSKK